MEPPAKRRKPAPRRSARLQSGGAAAAAAAAPASSSLSRVAALDGHLDDIAGQEAELRRRLEELARRRAPVQAERDELGGYLELVHAQPSPVPGYDHDLPADAPPTTLLAAQQRLALAALGHERLGAEGRVLFDLAGIIGPYVRGFDHFAEQAKVENQGYFGEEAAAARLQFRPPLPAAGERPEATGFLLEGHSTRVDGVYTLHSEEEEDGWPVLKNALGVKATVNPQNDEPEWVLHDPGNKKPDEEDDNEAYAYSSTGLLPTGASQWEIPFTDQYGSAIMPGMLTVTLLVRAPHVYLHREFS